MKFLNLQKVCGQLVFNLYSIGFEDGASGQDSKRKEELLILAKQNKLPPFYQDKINEVVCRAYVWGWEDSKKEMPKKSLEEVNLSVFAPLRKH